LFVDAPTTQAAIADPPTSSKKCHHPSRSNIPTRGWKVSFERMRGTVTWQSFIGQSINQIFQVWSNGQSKRD